MRRNALARQNAFAPQQAEPAGDDGGVTVVAGGADRTRLVEPAGEFTASERGQRNLAEARQLQQQIQLYTNLVNRNNARLRDVNLPDAQRRLLQSQVREYDRQLVLLRTRKKQLIGLEP